LDVNKIMEIGTSRKIGEKVTILSRAGKKMRKASSNFLLYKMGNNVLVETRMGNMIVKELTLSVPQKVTKKKKTQKRECCSMEEDGQTHSITPKSNGLRPKKKAMAAKGHFLGCYWDNCDRAYDDDFKDAKNKKVEVTYVDVLKTAKLAEKNKMPYFALQAGRECRMMKKRFNTYYKYPPVLGNSTCAKNAPKKASKDWANFGGAGWTNAICYTKKSPYYPGAF